MVMEAVNEASRNLGEQRAARLSTITGSVHALLAGIHRPGQ
jgi:hypothetical protein